MNKIIENKSTHILFNGEKIVISPDLWLIFDFLKKIEKEVESFLNFSKRLGSIRKQYLETSQCVQMMSKKLKENSIDFNFTFSESPVTIIDKLKVDHTVRSKCIVLFANLETLFCLNVAYENKISDQKAIINEAMKPEAIKAFLENFCLNKKNVWRKKSQKRLENITVNDLRKLRNALTHFFSVDGNLQIINVMSGIKSKKLKQAINFKAIFISPEDLYEIIKGTFMLMMKKWTDDYFDSIKNGSNEFKERILSVNNIVKNYGAIIAKNSQIDVL